MAEYINNEVEKSTRSEEKDKAAIEENIKNARNKLAELNTYMDVIFGLGGRRAYEYNRVTSEIYLTVGTVSEVFTRAIATRDALAKQIAAVKEAIDKEQDAEKKKALEANQTALVQRYALIVNALFNIYQVHPVRNYHFTPQPAPSSSRPMTQKSPSCRNKSRRPPRKGRPLKKRRPNKPSNERTT